MSRMRSWGELAVMLRQAGAEEVSGKGSRVKFRLEGGMVVLNMRHASADAPLRIARQVERLVEGGADVDRTR